VAAALFLLYAALTGVTFSMLFLVSTSTSIAATFLVTAAAFGGLSIVGLSTTRDLSAMGRFAFFALIGLIVASLVNLFLRSSGLDWWLTIAGVLIFARLTAYDTQRLIARVHGARGAQASSSSSPSRAVTNSSTFTGFVR
jgi:FtsH-binding integral membrane protein